MDRWLGYNWECACTFIGKMRRRQRHDNPIEFAAHYIKRFVATSCIFYGCSVTYFVGELGIGF